MDIPAEVKKPQPEPVVEEPPVQQEQEWQEFRSKKMTSQKKTTSQKKKQVVKEFQVEVVKVTPDEEDYPVEDYKYMPTKQSKQNKLPNKVE